MIDPQVAWDKLAQFKTAQDLKTFFEEEDIKGVVGNASQCPIAMWLTKTTAWPLVTVANQIKFFAGMGVECGADVKFPITAAMKDFVEWFDHSYYPDLIIGNENK